MSRKSITLKSNWRNYLKGTALSLPEVDADKLIKDGKAEALKGRYQTPDAPARATRKPAKKEAPQADEKPEA